MISLMEFWLASDPEERKKHLYRFKRLAWDRLKGFREGVRPLSMAEPFNDILGMIYPIFADWNKPPEKYEDFFRTFLEQSEQAVKSLLTTGDNRDLARAYTLASAGWFISGCIILERKAGKRVSENPGVIGKKPRLVLRKPP